MIMKKYSILFLVLILTACSLGDNPPSEQDMETAAAANYLEFNKKMEILAAECREAGAVILNPVKTVKCATICATDTKDCRILPTIEITNFKKLACSEAAGQPGWVCDYTYEISSQSDLVITMFQKIYGKTTTAQARFFKTDDGWMMKSN